MRISDWSSDVCSSDLRPADRAGSGAPHRPVDRGRTAPPRVGARGVAMSARSNVAAMTDALVHLERRADGVAVVRLDNGKVNALSTALRSEEHTSELQSLMRNSYAVFCLEKKKKTSTEKLNN